MSGGGTDANRDAEVDARIISWARQGARPEAQSGAGAGASLAASPAAAAAAAAAVSGLAVREWRAGSAVAVASPGLFRRDRLAVAGPPDELAPLVRAVLDEVGPSFRPLGRTAVIEQLVARMPSLRLVGTFGWMSADRLVGEGAADKAQWLDEAADEVNALLDAANPDSFARPGKPAGSRWAGLRDDSGALVAVAADAWSAPGLGFLCGVTTAVAARGRGHGEAVCRFALGELLAAHGHVALSVDWDNDAAIRLYSRLDLAWQDVSVAAVRQ